MTLSSLLPHNSPAVPPVNYDLPPVPDVDRTHWKGGGGGGWKGGKGNPNAALSALTLLAFLFFLNILQSCLKDTISNNNGMMVMVLPANATRIKREDIKVRRAREKDFLKTDHQNWSDIDITNLVHTHVESYWSTNGKIAEKKPLNSLKTNSKLIENNIRTWDRKITKDNKRISTKLIIHKKKENTSSSIAKINEKKPEKLQMENSPIENNSPTEKNKDNPLEKGLWTKTIGLFIENSIPQIEKIICCSNIACKEETSVNTNGSSGLIRKALFWFCKSVRPVVCALYSSPCQT